MTRSRCSPTQFQDQPELRSNSARTSSKPGAMSPETRVGASGEVALTNRVTSSEISGILSSEPQCLSVTSPSHLQPRSTSPK
jgi:hypothetical protein